MKLIYTVIDGMGDLPVRELGNETPLESAETPNMDFLAKNGKTGLMYTVGNGIAPESDVAVISILGYDPFRYSTGRGILEAIGADMPVKNGDLALRCNFATLDRENRIIDRRAGRNLTAEEANELSKALNRKLKLVSYPVDFVFKNTIGHRAVLVIQSKDKSLSSKITNTDPAYSKIEGLGVAKTKTKMVLQKSRPMEKSETSRVSAELVNEFVTKSHEILDKQEVNERRSAAGKLKANVILTRDAGHLLPKFFNIDEKYAVRFISLADMPVERGISKLTGMQVTVLPPPSNDLEKDCILRVQKLIDLLPYYNCFYIHIKGPDEPGHDGKYNRKKQMIATIDRHFFGKLLHTIKLENHLICVTADHATPCKLKAHSDDPVPLLISGNKMEGDNVSKFSENECKKGSLGVLEHGMELIPRLMGFLKAY